MTGQSAWTLPELKTVFQALASRTRLRIIEAVGAQDDVTVTELAERLRLSQPLLSWHLSILRGAGLVTTRREGRTVQCSLSAERLHGCWRQLLALAGDPDTMPHPAGPRERPVEPLAAR